MDFELSDLMDLFQEDSTESLDLDGRSPAMDAALGSKAPWEYTPNLNYMGDGDLDGIPNYADHHFGPGAVALGAKDNPLSDYIDDHDLAHEPQNAPANHDVVDANELKALEESESTYGAYSREDSLTIAGDPLLESEHWHYQEGEMSCAIVAQRGVLEAITGQDIPESDLVELAKSNGWFDPDAGTQPAAMGNILEAYGIPVERSYDSSIVDIHSALQRGDYVLVGLDANEIWNPVVSSEGTPLEQADMGHAVWITSLDLRSDGGIDVVMNDSGLPDGKAVTVRGEDFLNAWKDYGNYMVSTNLNGATSYA